MCYKMNTLGVQKILKTFIAGAILASTLNADFIRAEIGMGAWTHTPSGEINRVAVTTGDNKTEAYLWALVKHPVPLVPNLKVEYSNTVANNIVGSTTFKQYDIVPYYNLLDNTFWTTFDVGVNFKLLDVSMEATPIPFISPSIETDSIILPLAYVRSRFQIPFSGFAGEADVKYLAYSDTIIYDAKIKVDYTFTSFPVIEPGIEIGYRVQKIETSEFLSMKMAVDFEGVFVGMMVRF